MDKTYRWLQLRQADEQLKPWMASALPARPSCGWIQTIRSSLGMTAVALAQRLNMRSSSIHKFEQAEIDEAITLASLRKIAAALDCELQYALVPKKSLETTLRERAETVARQHLQPVSHSMSLEDQALPKGSHDTQIELHALELVGGSWRQLWSAGESCSKEPAQGAKKTCKEVFLGRTLPSMIQPRNEPALLEQLDANLR